MTHGVSIYFPQANQRAVTLFIYLFLAAFSAVMLVIYFCSAALSAVMLVNFFCGLAPSGCDVSYLFFCAHAAGARPAKKGVHFFSARARHGATCEKEVHLFSACARRGATCEKGGPKNFFRGRPTWRDLREKGPKLFSRAPDVARTA